VITQASEIGADPGARRQNKIQRHDAEKQLKQTLEVRFTTLCVLHLLHTLFSCCSLQRNIALQKDQDGEADFDEDLQREEVLTLLQMAIFQTRSELDMNDQVAFHIEVTFVVGALICLINRSYRC
jgi:hypothetical protein